MEIVKKFLLIKTWKKIFALRIPGTYKKPGTSTWFMVWITPERIKIYVFKFWIEFGRRK